jgi:protein tyrosine kinase modulator
MAATKLQSPGELHPLSLLRMVWKHQLLIFGTAALIFSAAVLYISGLPNVYRADAIVLVDSQTIPEKYVASTVQVNLQDNLNSISHQVLSSSRLQAIIDELGLYGKERAQRAPEEILDLIRRDLSITVERGFSGGRSGAFRISYEGPDRKIVAEVVNRISDLFISENVHNREERAEGTSEFIEAQLKQAKQNLDEQEANLSSYKTRWNGELPQQEVALLGNLNRLQVELQVTQDGISRAQQNKVLLEGTLQLAESSEAATMRALGADSQAAAGRAPVQTSDTVHVQLDAARVRYTDDHPEVKRLKAEFSRLLAVEAASRSKREQNASQSATVTPAVAPPVLVPSAASAALLTALNRERERIATTKMQIELLTTEIANRAAEEKRIERTIADYQSRVEKLPIREQQMAALLRDYETSKANYRSLLDKKISAEMASRMEREQRSERFTVADPARVPDKEIRPRRAMLSGAAGALALVLGFVLAMAIEFKKGTILGEWELPAGTPVIGRITHMLPPIATSKAEKTAVAMLALLFAGQYVLQVLSRSAF